MAALIAFWGELAMLARHPDPAGTLYLLTPALLMVFPVWAGLYVSAKAQFRFVRGIAAVAAAIAFVLTLRANRDIITSESSTAGIAFLFWPLYTSTIAGVVVGTAMLLAYAIDGRRRP